jgi:L-Ala-D/L-Glu epimerase / N-acetyl-D-glutamate racemase
MDRVANRSHRRHHAVRISAVDLVAVRIPLERPYRLSRGEVQSFKNVVVRLHGDDGLTGLGECDVLSVAGDIEDAFLRLGRIAPRLIGMDSLDVEAVVAACEPDVQPDLGIVAAYDLAAWDLNGRQLGLPVCRLLGGRLQDTLPVDYTLGQGTPESMAERARAMVDEGGFRGFCVKVGGGESLDDDLRRVEAVRTAIGPGPMLRADANGAYDVDTATRLLEALEPFNLEFIEQPLPARDLEGLRLLAGRVGVPISVDEGLRTPADAIALVQTGAVSVLNIKVSKCGGLLLSKRIAAVAEAAGIPWICGGGLAFEIVRQASRHFVAATPRLSEFHHEGPGPASQGLIADVVEPIVTYRDVKTAGGRVRVSAGPGLGVTEDTAALSRYGEESVSVPRQTGLSRARRGEALRGPVAPLELKPVAAWRADLRAAFHEFGRLEQYARGSFVYLEGERADAAYLLEAGRLESAAGGSSGRDISHTIHEAGDPFGFGELILRVPRSHSARVLEEASVWRLPERDLLSLLGGRPQLVVALMASALDHYLRHESVRASASGGSSRRRVAAVLKYLATPGSDPTGGRRALRLSHEEIARLSDLSRQTVTEVLDEFRTVGAVELRSREVVVVSEEVIERILGPH